MQPHLVGELVELRPLREADFAALYAAAADPLIWEQHPAARWREDVFRAFFAEHLASGGALLALDRATGAAIGTSRFDGYDAERSEIEIGWTFLARSHWGGAVNGEMKALMLDHAFRFVETVVFCVDPDNIRSQRAVAKLGAVRDGERRDDEGNLVFALTRGQLQTPLRRRKIETRRLVLVPLDRETASAIVAGDLSQLRHAEGWPHADTLGALQMALDPEQQRLVWLVTLDGAVIGDIGTAGPIDEHGDIEIGYGLAAEERGKGYGSEIVTGLAHSLLGEPAVRRVVARVEHGNVPSRRALERAGFGVERSDERLVYYALRRPG